MSIENFVKLQCSQCKRVNYHTHKNKKAVEQKKIELNRFCKWCKKHTLHKEGKK